MSKGPRSDGIERENEGVKLSIKIQGESRYFRREMLTSRSQSVIQSEEVRAGLLRPRSAARLHPSTESDWSE